MYHCKISLSEQDNRYISVDNNINTKIYPAFLSIFRWHASSLHTSAQFHFNLHGNLVKHYMFVCGYSLVYVSVNSHHHA